MKRVVFLFLLTLAACSPKVSSPDGRITITPGEGCCLVQYEGQKVLELQIPVTADDQLPDAFRQAEGLPV